MSHVKKDVSLLALGALLAASAALGTPVATTAQESQDERLEALRQRMEETRERLGLTDEQIEQLTPILQEGFEAQRAVLEEHGISLESPPAERSGSRLGRLRQMRQLGRDLDEVREATFGKIEESGILSEAQLAEYAELQEELRQALRERIRSRRGG